MNFLRNTWYVAAWSDELADNRALARKILDEPLVFWHGDGRPFAAVDRCPHRLAPLHMGQPDGATISCGYHGLAFSGRTGACVHNPHGSVTAALSISIYPCVERHSLVWIWMGDPARADPDDIPDLRFIDEALEHAVSRGYMATAASHSLLEDNILDLSHADYLHPATLGGGSITRSKAHVEERDDTVFVQWLSKDEHALPILRPELPDPDMLTDMWTEVLWHPNGVMRLRAGATPAGCPPEDGVDSLNAHMLTPESGTTTHYFYCNTRNFRTGDAAYNAAMAEGLRTAFENEDKPMIEAQQRVLGTTDLLEHRPALLGIDNASSRARRIYQRLVAAEAGSLVESA